MFAALRIAQVKKQQQTEVVGRVREENNDEIPEIALYVTDSD